MPEPTVYTFTRRGLDLFAPHRGTPQTGTKVVKVSLPHLPEPKGHTYVAHAETGEFLGMVQTHNLKESGS